ncbi:Sua5/YciO/YrdC/YwlC family protein [Gammaproteobacteria bacterium]|nr:Sua5/YciO/YrdC/YwlC family protein [Gammaproteobacteria bacterium]
MIAIDLVKAAKLIKNEGVVLHGTETVLGFCGLASSKVAAEKIKQLKGRDNEKGFIVLTNSIDAVRDWIQPLSAADKATLVQKKTPTTWLIKKSNTCPKHLTNTLITLAIRIPCHAQINALIDEIGAPIISTSANLSQRASSTDIHMTSHIFPSVPVLKPIQAMTGVASTIIDLSSQMIIR